MPEATPTQILAETLLRQSLAEWVAVRREAGLSWRSIATELNISTKGKVHVNRETLRSWFRESQEIQEVAL